MNFPGAALSTDGGFQSSGSGTVTSACVKKDELEQKPGIVTCQSMWWPALNVLAAPQRQAGSSSVGLVSSVKYRLFFALPSASHLEGVGCFFSRERWCLRTAQFAHSREIEFSHRFANLCHDHIRRSGDPLSALDQLRNLVGQFFDLLSSSLARTTYWEPNYHTNERVLRPDLIMGVTKMQTVRLGLELGAEYNDT